MFKLPNWYTHGIQETRDPAQRDKVPGWHAKEAQDGHCTTGKKTVPGGKQSSQLPNVSVQSENSICCILLSMCKKGEDSSFIVIQFINQCIRSGVLSHVRNFVSPEIGGYSPMFSSRSFTVSSFMVSSMLYVNLILDMIWGRRFIFPVPFLKRPSFPFVVRHPCRKRPSVKSVSRPLF